MKRVVVIAPHPDDEVLGCGGVMARHAAAGDEVTVVVATRGVPSLFAPEEIERTRGELRAAHALLGVSSVHFLDFPAPQLDTVPSHEVADALRAILRRGEPDVVYLPHRGDIHRDHGVVHMAALVAVRPEPGRRSPTLLAYETLSETEWAPPTGDQYFIPTVYVDISAHLETKLRAMAAYASQLKAFPHPRSLEALRALAQLRGATVAVPAAEAFVLVRHVVG